MLAETIARAMTGLDFVNLFSPIDLKYYFADKRQRLADAYPYLSVEEVAARAGVSKATIYRRFSTKDDLVVASLLDGEIPFVQSPLALRRRESFVVGYVIHRTAESIKKHRIPAAFPWEKKKSEGEIGISRLRE